VVEHQLRDDVQPAPVRLGHEIVEVGEAADLGVDRRVVRDVVAVVPARRRIEGKEPERRDAEVLQVRQLARQAEKIADAVVVTVEERADAHLVDDGVLVPGRLVGRVIRATARAHRVPAARP
jgi:hypothetical protein